MAKQGEIDYLRNLGEEGIRHAALKPFSDPNCPHYLAQISAVMALLPPPPARLLDLGCGTGWTSVFFAKAGYDVIGVDIAGDMITVARQNAEREGLDELRFVEADYEGLAFDDEFDAAVFFDSLHHAVDEEAAIAAACRALRRGGVCVTMEPGQGHAEAVESQAAVQRFGVTEKDMPPTKIIALGRKAGFMDFRVYPSASYLQDLLYRDHIRRGYPGFVAGMTFKRKLISRLLLRWLGIGSGLFQSPLAELHYVQHLVNFFRTVPAVGGIVRLEK